MRFLAQLRPRRFHSANRVWELTGGNEDNSLWARFATWVHVDETVDQVLGVVPTQTSVFELTDEDRELVAAGANVALTIIGHQPPVMLHLTDEPLGRAP